MVYPIVGTLFALGCVGVSLWKDMNLVLVVFIAFFWAFVCWGVIEFVFDIGLALT